MSLPSDLHHEPVELVEWIHGVSVNRFRAVGKMRRDGPFQEPVSRSRQDIGRFEQMSAHGLRSVIQIKIGAVTYAWVVAVRTGY